MALECKCKPENLPNKLKTLGVTNAEELFNPAFEETVRVESLIKATLELLDGLPEIKQLHCPASPSFDLLNIALSDIERLSGRLSP